MSGHTHDDIDWADRLAQLRMADTLDAEALAPVAGGWSAGCRSDRSWLMSGVGPAG